MQLTPLLRSALTTTLMLLGLCSVMPAKGDEQAVPREGAEMDRNQAGRSIDELASLEINGAKQWLLYRGEDRTKPIVLFVHGGPGCPLMWYSRGFDSHLLKDFVVVHWDQRGAGKSCSPNIPIETCTLDQIVDDGLKVAEHLKQKFGTDRIILVGHSWGTMVAGNMAQKSPSEFLAFVSVGTCSDWKRGEDQRYALLLSLACEKNDVDAMKKLGELGPPPHLSSEQIFEFGELVMRLIGYSGSSRKLTEEQLMTAMLKNTEYSPQEFDLTPFTESRCGAMLR